MTDLEKYMTDDELLRMLATESASAVARFLGVSLTTVNVRANRRRAAIGKELLANFIEWVDDDTQSLPSTELVTTVRHFLSNGALPS